MVAHIVCGSALWDVKPEAQRAGGNETIAQSIKASKAQRAFAKERKAIRALLQLHDKRTFLIAPNWETTTLDLAVVFARLLQLSDKQVMRVLTFTIVETLEAGAPVVEALGHILSVDMADWWEPDDVFFDLLRDKPAINAMLAEVAGKHAAKDGVNKTAKIQKDTIRGFREGRDGAVKPEGWLPRYMRFPMQGYTKRKGLAPLE